ncbi:DUF6884 domain-containing protein [Paraliobacillus sp. X-1268]|uniref:DUF6884 domain-containing protein n=1 Tax=Paraliobacillus sp. X-1268 TaxID=2213193 RepID=UPI000E3BB2EA|nr:DUF6884 domain-containing protein [Paraliobacillus sp. X-1268]
MKQLAIIPCGKKKIWDSDSSQGPTVVKDAYIGVLHRMCEQYAEMFCNQWVVLSGKHGLMLPYEIILEDYNVTFEKKYSEEVISIKELQAQLIDKKLDTFDQIISLTGKKYQPIIEETFGPDQNIRYPLLGTKGIGEMQQRLKYAVENNKILH